MVVDLSIMTDEELLALSQNIATERERRRLPAAVDDLIGRFRTIEGVQEGQEWVQPTGAMDAYPQGWRVLHNGKEWVSLTPANVWEPGVANWRQTTAEGAPAAWVQPSGATDSYPIGSVVTHGGQTWVATVGDNVWEPGVYGWETQQTSIGDVVGGVVDDTVGGIGNVVGGLTNNITTVNVPTWEQPTGSADAYNIGDQVTFQEKTYESVIDGNIWSPSAYPAGWQEVT